MGKVKKLFRGLKRYFRASIYARLLPYILPYKLAMSAVVLLLLAQVAIGLLEPWWIQIVVDNGLSGKQFPDWLLEFLPFLTGASRHTIIVFAVVAGIAVRLLGIVVEVIGNQLKTRVNYSVTLAFQADLFNHLQRLSLSYHDQTTV